MVLFSTLLAVLFKTELWFIFSQITGLPQRYDDENCSQLGVSLWKESAIRHGGSQSLEKFPTQHPAFDLLLPYQRQSRNVERALPAVLAYLGAAADGALKQASPVLCPSVGRAGQSRSSLQPHCAGIPSPSPQHGPKYQGNTGGRPLSCWAGMEQGAQGERGARNRLILPLESERHQSRIATEGKLSSCQTQELLLYLMLKRERKCRFLWFLANLKLDFCQHEESPLRTPLYIDNVYRYLISGKSPAEKAWLKGAAPLLMSAPRVAQMVTVWVRFS